MPIDPEPGLRIPNMLDAATNGEFKAIYIQGAGWRTLEVIEMLEQDLGVPVVHAVASKVWEIQKRLRIHAPRDGFGTMLRALPDLRDD